MKQQGLAYFTQIDLSIFAMMIFFVWFIALLVWVYRILPDKKIHAESQLPFNDEVYNG